jgi:high-affinity K+ transport system ATPase subunit B
MSLLFLIGLPRIDPLCANRHLGLMIDTRLGVQGMVLRILHWLRPGQANRRPVLFILEIGAALLSVLALRDGILGGPAVSLEALSAVGLWATLLVVACRLAIREH